MSTAVKLSLVLALCWGVTLAADQGRGQSKKENGHPNGARYERDADRDKDRGSYFERRGYARLKIPPGHYPPPGECRVWHPDRPPGHQPPPVRCDRLGSRIPAGAWVIRHPANDPDHVHVVVYDERRPGSIFVVGQFKIATGVFVRVVVDR